MKREDEDFFVGYLPAPRKLARFSVLAGVAMLFLAAGVAFALSGFQRSPGPNLEREAYNQEVRGVYVSLPYPTVFLPDGTGVLLVRPGKSGTPRRSDLEGSVVTAKGLKLERDGRQLFETYSLEAATGVASDPPALRLLGEKTLTGFVVDSKCFYGRMRPGEGKPHRACAQYCIDSGIPPVFVVESSVERAEHFVLTKPDGSPINREILPFVAEPIRIAGRLSQRGDVRFLAVDIDAIQRL